MIPIKNEAAAIDLETLKKAEHQLSATLHDKGELLKGNKEIWKSLIALRTWLKKAIAGENSAGLQIRCYADKLLLETAHELHSRGEEEQRMQEESPLIADKPARAKSHLYFESYNELLDLHKMLQKKGVIAGGESCQSIPIAV